MPDPKDVASPPSPTPAAKPQAQAAPAPIPVPAPATAESTPQAEPPAFETPTAANPGDRGWRPPLVQVTRPPIPSHWQHRKRGEP